MLLRRGTRGFTSARPRREQFEEEYNKNHIQLSSIQKTLLTVGSAAVALADPHRGDMIACLGETTGWEALKLMKRKMEETEEGSDILMDRPRINSNSLDYKYLHYLPAGTLGKTYHNFLVDNGVTADSRLPVQFVDDIELGYVMQRYREVHDLVHATLAMKTNMLGEVTVKWIEAFQTGLPMCIGGGIFGAVRLKPKHRNLYLKYYLPWAIKTGLNARFLQSIYFEKRWEQDLNDFYREMNIEKLVYHEES